MVLTGALLALQLAIPQSEPGAVRALVVRARSARYQQDSTLASYEAMVRQRMSGGIGLARGLGLGPIARERLAARFESVARVGWHHEFGAWAEVLGARSVLPIVGQFAPDPEERSEDAALVLPYAPGRDALWPVDELRDAVPNVPNWIAHPLATGADSLYAFSLGDSLVMRLPDGALVRLRELRVRPRRPDEHLIVGSLWVDAERGSLVRAAYRPSVPMDLWPLISREIGRNDRDRVKAFGPFSGTIREILVEHGLYAGRFWLPRARMFTGEGTARGAKVTISIQQTFTYERVAAMPAGTVARIVAEPVDVDPRTGRARRPSWYGIQDRTGRCRERGDSSGRWSRDSLMRDQRLTIARAEGIRFRILVPCDTRDLTDAPELPPSIYDGEEALFTDTDFSALRSDVDQALALSSQAEWNPLPTTFHYGVTDGLIRYNRVEGLSAGVSARRVLGNGYDAGATVRLGNADLVPNAELRLRRSNVRSTVTAAAFHRLVAANDWGQPLGLGASINALLFGRDDGFYYRTLGAELAGTHQRAPRGAAFGWRLFAEQQGPAAVETHASLAHALNGVRFAPNIAAHEAIYAGAAASAQRSWGLDPRGARLALGGRVDAASAGGVSQTYGRAMTELTTSHGICANATAGLTLAGGAAAGALPLQRHWYVGGAYSVRGHRAGTQSGDAFWLARAELARGLPIVRAAVFMDAGWAGDRRLFARAAAGRPLSGAGFGLATLDGLLRLDVSRAIEHDRRWRVDLYFDPR